MQDTWIKITERLPDFEEVVIVVNTEVKQYNMCRLTQVNDISSSKGTIRQYEWMVGHSNEEWYHDPTHWQPLLPPKD